MYTKCSFVGKVIDYYTYLPVFCGTWLTHYNHSLSYPTRLQSKWVLNALIYPNSSLNPNSSVSSDTSDAGPLASVLCNMTA